MTTLEILDSIEIPPLRNCGEELDKWHRLKTYYYKLSIAEECNTNDEALNLINNLLVEVEDCHSGQPADAMPSLGYTGRMYPIQDDFITRDGEKIIARSKGNEITIENNGDFIIKDRKTQEIIITKIRYN